MKDVGFEQAKGNLFEYIEAAKLQINLANETGQTFDRTPLADAGKNSGGWSEHTAPDDFRFSRGGKIAGRGQAKFNR